MLKRGLTLVGMLGPRDETGAEQLKLADGSRVGVIGGGPAGSYFTYFLLDMADRMDLEIEVDVYEPRDYFTPGPVGCNMCGGIVSESMVQILAAEGINLPPTVVQRGIGSYVLHMDVGSVEIETPLQEMRIAAVHRGAGPRDLKARGEASRWDSFDGYLQTMTVEKGARIIKERVAEVGEKLGMPWIKTRAGQPVAYDLIAVATGVNTPLLKNFEDFDLIKYKAPKATKTFICEYRLGEPVIEEYLGDAMHVFLLDIPRLKFAAIIPKGDYATVCMLGEDIDKDLFMSFLHAPEVQNCMPPGWKAEGFACNCAPRMNIEPATQPFGDRVIFIGDCGVTRLYKDGIGGAYRAAKAAASTAVFHGISQQDFEKHYLPACKKLDNDNQIGKIVFMVTKIIQKIRFARRAMLNMTTKEQAKEGASRRMSMILWDTFTGSATYSDIFKRTLHPVYVSQFLGELALSFVGLGTVREAKEA